MTDVDTNTPALTPSGIVAELQWRGLIANSTDLEALDAATAQPITLYCGFDPTAPSLHLGNLAQIMTIRRFQLYGHRPLALVGGSTGLIGDPKMTGERTLNPQDVVDEWVARIGNQLSRFYSFEGENAAVMVNNYDWTGPVHVLDFLRDVGKHFSINRLLARETVATRLAGEGMSFTEFSYGLLQAFDYVNLFERYNCVLQTGGSDQWGNIAGGVELVRKMKGASVHGLTTPLLTKADGTKFGKTESGTVWLDAELTSPYAFYQFWMQADDRDVAQLLRMYSLRSRAEIEELDRRTAQEPGARAAQRALAQELTTLVHGEAEMRGAEAAAEALFGRGELAELPGAALIAALREAPHGMMSKSLLSAGVPIVDVLVASQVVKSKGEARRTIAEGGAYLNNERVTDVDLRISQRDVLVGGWVLLRRGKRTMGGVQFFDDSE